MRLQKEKYEKAVEKLRRGRGAKGASKESTGRGSATRRRIRKRYGQGLWLPGAVLGLMGVFALKVHSGLKVGIGWNGWFGFGVAGLDWKEEDFRFFWGTLGGQEETEHALRGMKKSLVSDLLVLAVIGRSLEIMARGRWGWWGRLLVLLGGLARCAEMVAWYLGGRGVTGGFGEEGEGGDRMSQDLTKLFTVMKWGEIGKIGLGGVGLLALGIGAVGDVKTTKKKE